MVSGISYKYCVMMSVGASFLISLVQSPIFLAKLSVFTNLVMFSGILIIFSQLEFGDKAASRGEINLYTSPIHFLVGLASLVTCLGGLTTTLDVERTMRHRPGRYHVILKRMLVFAVVTLGTIGLISYASFRDHTDSVLSLSLDEGRAKTAAEIILVVGPALESVLNSFQLFVIVETRLKAYYSSSQANNNHGDNNNNNDHSGQQQVTTTMFQWVTMRVICFVTAAAFSIAVPSYGIITALAGAFGYGALAFIMPPMMELKIIAELENNDTRQQQQGNEDEHAAGDVPMEERIGVSSGNENNNNEVVTNSLPPPPPPLARGEESVSPSRKIELYTILVLGFLIISCGGFAAIRQIAEGEDG